MLTGLVVAQAMEAGLRDCCRSGELEVSAILAIH